MTRLLELPAKYLQDPGAHISVKRPVGRPRKYHNIPTEYCGFVYDSKKEAEFARTLDLRLQARDLKDWNQQVKVVFGVTHSGRLVAKTSNAWLPAPEQIVVFAHKITTHFVDFLLVHPDGSLELVELKSDATKTSTWRLKLALLEATLLHEHPEIRYTVA